MISQRNSFFKGFICVLLERGEGMEKEKKRNMDVLEKHLSVASCLPLIRDLACNPGMCLDWESNQQPFGWQAGNQSTEPH